MQIVEAKVFQVSSTLDVSYLTDRTQYVQIVDRSSERINVSSGVPQGFILRPLLFNLYVNDLTDVLPTEVNCHQYYDL